MSKQRPLSVPRIGLFLFGFVFFAAGALFLWLVAIHPMWQWNQARSWQQTHAQIQTSKIVEKRDDEGTNYHPEVTYRYVVNENTYSGDRIQFGSLSGSRKHAAAVTETYPEGAASICFFDPGNPGDSVLNRDSPLTFLMIFPAPFLLTGLFVMYLAIVGEAKAFGSSIANRPREPIREEAYHALVAREATASPLESSCQWIRDADQEDQRWDQPQKLKPESTKFQRLVLIGFFAGFWNSIVSVFVFGLISDADPGGLLCFGLFLTPFILIGLGLLVAFFHTLLAMFGPKVRIATSSGAVPLGGEIDIAWEFSGRTNRIRYLEISVTGTESATYIRGTSVQTDEEVFYGRKVVETGDAKEIRFGSRCIRIPDSKMHTFDGTNNRVAWSIEVRAVIPYWPDVHESFPFRVKPIRRNGC